MVGTTIFCPKGQRTVRFRPEGGSGIVPAHPCGKRPGEESQAANRCQEVGQRASRRPTRASGKQGSSESSPTLPFVPVAQTRRQGENRGGRFIIAGKGRVPSQGEPSAFVCAKRRRPDKSRSPATTPGCRAPGPLRSGNSETENVGLVRRVVVVVVGGGPGCCRRSGTTRHANPETNRRFSLRSIGIHRRPCHTCRRGRATKQNCRQASGSSSDRCNRRSPYQSHHRSWRCSSPLGRGY